MTDTTFRMLDRSCPYVLDKLVAKRMQSKRRRSKPYPKAVLEMVDDFQPGETEQEDYTIMADEDFDPPDFDFDDDVVCSNCAHITCS